jgi:hypothetical protein
MARRVSLAAGVRCSRSVLVRAGDPQDAGVFALDVLCVRGDPLDVVPGHENFGGAVQRALEDLAAHELVERRSSDTGEDRWTLSELVRDCAAQRMLDDTGRRRTMMTSGVQSRGGSTR